MAWEVTVTSDNQVHVCAKFEEIPIMHLATAAAGAKATSEARMAAVNVRRPQSHSDYFTPTTHCYLCKRIAAVFLPH